MFKAGNFWCPDGDIHLSKWYEKEDGWHLDRLQGCLDYINKHGNFGIAIDGGAHCGSWTRKMAEVFDTVHSFEVNPLTFECLERNIKDWGLTNVVLHDYGLGDKTEFVSMSEDPKWPGNTGGLHITGEGDFPVKMLDDIDIGHVDFFKMDLEGYEEKAMRGGKKLITKSKPFIMIEHKRRINERFGGVNDDINFLAELGYVQVANFKSDVLFGPK